MVDLTSLQKSMQAVVGAPGFKNKEPIKRIIEIAEKKGLVRHLDFEVENVLIPTNASLYYEMVKHNRIVVFRFVPSEPFKITDFDQGYVPKTAVWIIDRAKKCRAFDVEVCPNYQENIWLTPTLQQGGAMTFQYGGIEYEYPCSDFADIVAHLCYKTNERPRLRISRRAVSDLRYMFIIYALKFGTKKIPNLPLPKLKRGIWRWEIIVDAWEDALEVVDPLNGVEI